MFLGKYHPDRDTWTLNYRVPRKLTRKLKTVWTDSAYDAGTHGTELLRRLLGEPRLFPFPKSLYAVKDCLAAVVGNRPNALVVDFFAGSGTTFHATCLLNLEDGGSRRSILVTNNEVSMETAARLHNENFYRGDPEFEKWGIFERATRPRCEAVVTGRRPDGTPIEGYHISRNGNSRGHPFSAGFEENVEFYEIEYLDSDDIELGKCLEALLPSLWLASGGIGDREIQTKDNGFSIPEKSTYSILLKESRFRKFKEALLKRPDITHVWLVTDSEDAFAEMRSALPKSLNSSMLYKDYLSSFMTNARRLP
jgi:adenine-specific DNA-methyltransferase